MLDNISVACECETCFIHVHEEGHITYVNILAVEFRLLAYFH